MVPVDHPWRVKNRYTEIRHQSTKFGLSVEALRINCAFHLKLDETDASAFSKYRVANLHWPVALVKNRRKRARLIDGAEVKSYDKMATNYAKSRFFDFSIKVGNILKKFDDPAYRRQELSAIAELYVQAPACTQAEVKTCLKSMTSERAMRRVTLRSRSPVPSPSSPAESLSSLSMPLLTARQQQETQ